MLDLHPSLVAAIQSQSAFLATCWTITRQDGVISRFTDADRDVVINGLTYSASTGFSRTASENTVDGTPQNLDIESFFSSSGITQHDLRTGLYQMARVVIFLVNRLDLPSSLPSNKTRVIGRCIIAGSEFDSLQVKIKLQSVSALLNNTVGLELTELCGHDFCDVGSNPYSRCTLSASTYQTNGSVVLVPNQKRIFRWNISTKPEGEYDKGLVEFLSGENQGFKSRVQYYSAANQEFALYDVTPYPIAVGDNIRALSGCLKTKENCRDRYNNIINFGGAPDLPGNDVYVNPDSEPA